jgi:hypothetical protein
MESLHDGMHPLSSVGWRRQAANQEFFERFDQGLEEVQMAA